MVSLPLSQCIGRDLIYLFADAASVPPLAPDLLEQATELPTPPPIQVESQNDKDKGKARTSNTLSGEEGMAGGSGPKLPKWFKGPASKS